MDDHAKHEVTLYFEHWGRPVRLQASAKGWAQMWLKANPLSYRSRKSRQEHEQDALRQGHLAVSSILRDWIKGQVTGGRVWHPVLRSRVHAVHADRGRPPADRVAEGNRPAPGA